MTPGDDWIHNPIEDEIARQRVSAVEERRRLYPLTAEGALELGKGWKAAPEPPGSSYAAEATRGLVNSPIAAAGGELADHRANYSEGILCVLVFVGLLPLIFFTAVMGMLAWLDLIAP